MVTVKKLRGEDWAIDTVLKTVSVTIRKPQQGKRQDVFSVSDVVVHEYVKKGYTAVVTVSGQEKRITESTPVVFKEQVPSKFAGMAPWYRYWYSIGKDNTKQMKWGF